MSECCVDDGRVVPSVAQLADLVQALAAPVPDTDDVARIELIAAMEQAKCALAAAQARLTVAFKHSQLADQRATGVPARDLGRGIGAQVALARRESPHRGGRLVGLAEALVDELPNTLAAMTSGQLSEWRAMIVAKETACLSVEHRRQVDARLAGRLTDLSDAQLFAQTRKHAYQLDPAAVLARAAKAAADRRVTLRPSPDTMAILTGLLPVTQGVAVYAALRTAADGKRAAGDPRTRGQIMADTLVEKVTGQAAADQVPVEVQLLITDKALLGGDHTPARINGHGPIPAVVARRLIAGLHQDTASWIRRLYTDPTTGQLTTIESARRTFTGALRRAILIRDDLCRTPWCGAPIRHIDHVIPAHNGGPTSQPNGQGLCQACNHAKQAPGWRGQPGPGGAGESVRITTPTGHTYTSRPPPLPGTPEDPPTPTPDASRHVVGQLQYTTAS